MILAIFGTLYAVCVAILAITFLSWRPLPTPERRPAAGAEDEGSGKRDVYLSSTG